MNLNLKIKSYPKYKVVVFSTFNQMEEKEELLKITDYLMTDAFFSKFNFVELLSSSGFYIISRLRNDADLRYLFTEKQKPKGRPKKYDGKINFQKLND